MAKTVTLAVPAVATSGAGTVAVSDDDEMKVVVSAAPFHCTTDDEAKREPVTVSVNKAEPAVVDVGEIEEMLGPDTETCDGVIAPDKATFTPADRDDCDVLKKPTVVDAKDNPDICANLTSSVAPTGSVEGT